MHAVVLHVTINDHSRLQLENRGFDAVPLTDLPSTALAPDGRGWRTAYRSFAAVAVTHGAPGGADDPAVRW